MAEYIERDSISEVLDGLVERIEDSLKHSTQFGSGCDYAIRYISNKVEDIPAANVRPERHSHWHEYESCVFMGRYGKDGEPIFQDRKTFMCVKCGRNTIIKETFCPSCGAKMDGTNQKGDIK